MDFKTFLDQWKASHKLFVLGPRITDADFYKAAAAAGVLQPWQDGKGKVTVNGQTYSEMDVNGNATGQDSGKLGEAIEIGSKVGMGVLGGAIAAPYLAGAAAPTVAAPTVAATVAGPTAATVGGFSSPSLWASLAGPAIGAGTQLAGAAINAHAQGEATDAQTAANKDALDFQKQKLAEEDQRLAPYRATGADAIGRLGTLYDFASAKNTGSGPSAAPFSVAAPAQGTVTTGTMPRSNLASLGQMPTQSQALVTVQAPTGERRQVPAAQAQFYQSRGATIVPTTGAA